MTDKKISVLLVDDHKMVREGLALLIDRDPRLNVVGQCGDGLRVLGMVNQLKPQVVVLDIELPGLNGLDVCHEISKKHNSVAVLILTMHDDEVFVMRAVQSGAKGYLLKDAAAKKLSDGIVTIANGLPFFNKAIKRKPNGSLGGDIYDTLTLRERQVLQMIAEGKTSRQIAQNLHLAVKTVETHRTRLMGKLDIHNINALVKYAIKRGIVQLP